MKLEHAVSLAQALVPRARGGDLVLAYHLVGAGTDSPVDLPIPAFEQQLDQLASAFEFSTLSALLTRPSGAGSKPRVVLTFDDAYANFSRVVWPLLAKRGVPAVLYAPVGFVSGTAGPPLRGASLPACSFADLRQLSDAGVEIGSHGVNHLNLRRVSNDVLADELRASREALEHALGRPVTSFCYPQAKLDGRVAQAAAQHYDSAVAAGGRRFFGRDLMRIPRFPIRRDEPRFDTLISTRVWLREAVASGARQWRR